MHFLPWRNSPYWAKASSLLRIYDHTQFYSSLSVVPFWTSDQPDAEASTWRHTTFTTDRHPCPWRHSNPKFQQVRGHTLAPWIARALGSAMLCLIFQNYYLYAIFWINL